MGQALSPKNQNNEANYQRLCRRFPGRRWERMRPWFMKGEDA